MSQVRIESKSLGPADHWFDDRLGPRSIRRGDRGSNVKISRVDIGFSRSNITSADGRFEFRLTVGDARMDIHRYEMSGA